MKKLFIFSLFVVSLQWNAQRIGLAVSYNPNLMHAHLKGIPNSELQAVEDLNYSVKPFIDSIFLKSNLSIRNLENFDLSVFDHFDPIHGNKAIEKQLAAYCGAEGLDGLIVLKPYGNDKGRNMMTAALEDSMDFGLITSEHAKKNLMYYNNIIILYYTLKEDKLRYPVRKKAENLFYPLQPVKSTAPVFSAEDKKLTDMQKFKSDFLSDFKKRLVLNLQQIFAQIAK